ncbi:MAG: hypothetical protein QM617_13500 [Comamonas sp.]
MSRAFLAASSPLSVRRAARPPSGIAKAEAVPTAQSWQARLAPGARATVLAIGTDPTPLCLVPGQWLLGVEGCVAIESGPQVWGQVLVRARHRLEAGDVIEGGEDGLPTWLRLSSEAGAARIAVVEAAPRPGVLRQLLAWLG